MAMTACYRNFDLPQISQGVSAHQLNHQTRHHAMALQTLQTAATALSPVPQLPPPPQQPQKDYSIPLHVDCSVEYELPNQAKPPVGARIEPLLMIHPCYFRKMESQRRSPFINNMPNSSRSSNSISSSTMDASSSSRHSNNNNRQQHSSVSTVAARSHLQNTNSHILQASHQLPTTGSSSSNKIRSTHNHQQQQINLQQQIDDYVQRQIVQMSAPAPPSAATYRHSTHNSQSTSNSSNNTNQMIRQADYMMQQQHTPSSWEHYMPNTTLHHKSNHIMTPDICYSNNQKSKVIQCHNNATIKQQQQIQQGVSHISNNNSMEGGLVAPCTGGGRWDIIEKTSSMAAIPRDYQSGPECIPPPVSTIQKATQNTMYRNTVGKRDAMLSGGCQPMYTDNTAEIALGLWKQPETMSSSRGYEMDSNLSTSNTNHSNNNLVNNSKLIMNNKTSSSSSSMTLTSSGHNIRSYNSAATPQLTNHQDQRHLISGKYKQYLRSQRMHPYSMLTAAGPTAIATNAFSQLGTNPMFQQVSCFNV